MKLLFITNNNHKLQEASQILADYDLQKLSDLPRIREQKNWTPIPENIRNSFQDIPEPFDTFKKNSSHKANFIHNQISINCFSEDSWLQIQTLNQEPWVFSARYSGDHDDQANIKKVLQKLDGIEDRSANFIALITLIINWQEFQFEWKCYWKIAKTWDWNLSFWYDPIFIPDWYQKTFDELWDEIKQKVSHRKIALQKMMEFIKTNY